LEKTKTKKNLLTQSIMLQFGLEMNNNSYIAAYYVSKWSDLGF